MIGHLVTLAMLCNLGIAAVAWCIGYTRHQRGRLANVVFYGALFTLVVLIEVSR